MISATISSQRCILFSINNEQHSSSLQNNYAINKENAIMSPLIKIQWKWDSLYRTPTYFTHKHSDVMKQLYIDIFMHKILGGYLVHGEDQK